MNLTIKEICQVLEGKLLNKNSQDLEIKGLSIDSREPHLKNKIFFCIKGHNSDGHYFIEEAFKKGALAVVVHSDKTPKLKNIIKTENTSEALQKLALYWRKKNKFHIIGITGSQGKTTTKHFCQILLEKDFPIKASPKSYNNIYGLPLTLLNTESSTKYIIQEMGTNHAGEIQKLCEIAPPQTALVTTVGRSHIGKFNNSIAKLALEKEQIYQCSAPNACSIYNLDNPYTNKMYQKNSTKNKITFSSQNSKADVHLKINKCGKDYLSIAGRLQSTASEARVPVTGRVQLVNLMGASALALAVGVKPQDLWDRLSLCTLPIGRSQWLRLKSGAEVLFDAYNASPESVQALLDHFLSPAVKGPKGLILGDFMELGSYLKEFHQKIAQHLAQNPPKFICFIGEQGEHFAKALNSSQVKCPVILSEDFNSDLAKKILSMLNPSFVLAFKASRKTRMEVFLNYFEPVKGFNVL